MTATVTHKPKLNRYVVVGDAEAGYLSYIPFSGAVHFEHTEIREEFSGRGLPSQLIRYALDDTRARGTDHHGGVPSGQGLSWAS